MRPDALKKKKNSYLRILLFLSVIALGLFWTGTHSLEERIVTVRFFLFALSGFIAFSIPYLFFPDPNASLMQLGNISGQSLLKYLLEKAISFFSPVIVLIAVMLFGDLQQPAENVPVKVLYFIMASMFTSGLLLFSVIRYLKSGIDSQFWKESEKGRELRKNMADYFKFPLDPGSVPSLINTILIALIGMLTLVVSSILYGLTGPLGELSTGLILFAIGAGTVISVSVELERYYYSSNAFFREFFGATLSGKEDIAERTTDQLWWVPENLKVHVWQFLLQIDRKIPAGRVVGAGHALLWFIAYQKPEEEFITSMWILFGVSHHLFTLMTLNNEMAPKWLLIWIGKGSKNLWLWSRFWLQIRWILPLLLSMNIQLFIFGTPGWIGQSIVLIVYMVSGFIISLAGVMQLRKDVYL